MAGCVHSRSGGTREDELSLRLTRINLVPRKIPKTRLQLPLVDEARGATFEQYARVGRHRQRDARISFNIQNTPRLPARGFRFPAALRPLNEHSTLATKSAFELAICKPWNV